MPFPKNKMEIAYQRLRMLAEQSQSVLFHNHRDHRTGAAPTRLWALDFVDAEHPEWGGTITALVEGVFPNSDPNSALPLMIDNMTVTESGLVFMCEDPVNNPRLSRVWMYDPLADDGIDPASGLTNGGYP